MRALVLALLLLAPLAAAQTGLEQTEQAQDTTAPCGPGTTTGAGSETQGPTPGGSCPSEAQGAPEETSTFVGNPWAWIVVGGVLVVGTLAILVARAAFRTRRAPGP